MPEYAIILLALLVISIFLHRYFKVKIFQSGLQIILLYVIVLVVAVVWDQFAIWRGHWSFNEKFLIGPKIGYMPIEEYGFILVVSYFGLVVYKITEKLTKG